MAMHSGPVRRPLEIELDFIGNVIISLVEVALPDVLCVVMDVTKYSWLEGTALW